MLTLTLTIWHVLPNHLALAVHCLPVAVHTISPLIAQVEPWHENMAPRFEQMTQFEKRLNPN